MPRVLYAVAPHHRLIAFGKTVMGGQTEEFTDVQLRTLLAEGVPLAPVPFPAPDPSDRPSVHGSRRQWARYAEKRGVAVTERMTRDDIIAAVDARAA